MQWAKGLLLGSISGSWPLSRNMFGMNRGYPSLPQQEMFFTAPASCTRCVYFCMCMAIPLTCRYESVGQEGYHSLYKWYQAFEEEHFPDPKGLRHTLARWSLGIYPNCIKALMAVFDVPEAIAVSRTAMCAGSKAAPLSRLQVSIGLTYRPSLFPFCSMSCQPHNKHPIST